MKINIASNEVIHFIGIGGIGMSGLAQIMNNMGFTIQGSDLKNDPGVIYVYLSYSFIGIIIGSVVGFVACQVMNIIIEKKRYNYWRYGG